MITRLIRPRRIRSAYQIEAITYSNGVTVTHCAIELGNSFTHENGPNQSRITLVTLNCGYCGVISTVNMPVSQQVTSAHMYKQWSQAYGPLIRTMEHLSEIGFPIGSFRQCTLKLRFHA